MSLLDNNPQIQQLYGADISESLVSKITDFCLIESNESLRQNSKFLI
jgi:hypothetical protein